tara:strand:- start:236 stop:574 length:339 start_codon:yes stop_codon:yes gene_type:complete
MTYVILDPETWILNDRYQTFKTVGAAKRSLTAKIKKAQKVRDYYIEQYGDRLSLSENGDLERIKRSVVMSYEEFDKKEPMVIRKNFMSGKTFIEKLNTPNHCSPSSETYWSM